MIFESFINFVYVALSGGTLLISVMSQQYNCLMELCTNFHKILFLMKMYLPFYFILRYVRAEINAHAFMHELDQQDYWYPRKMKFFENLCTKSMDSCPLVISHILAEFHPGRHTQVCISNSLKWIIQICSNFYFWVSKIAFYSPNPRCCLGKLPL